MLTVEFREPARAPELLDAEVPDSEPGGKSCTVAVEAIPNGSNVELRDLSNLTASCAPRGPERRGPRRRGRGRGLAPRGLARRPGSLAAFDLRSAAQGRAFKIEGIRTRWQVLRFFDKI